jgi:hypothetical protein
MSLDASACTLGFYFAGGPWKRSRRQALRLGLYLQSLHLAMLAADSKLQETNT